MKLTLQVHWDNQWHDAGTVTFKEPDKGLLGTPTFSYETDYIIKALENADDFDKEDLIDRTAVSVNLPCHFTADYFHGEIVPVLRDIIPQGAGRRQLLKSMGYDRDPEHAVDTRLLAEGCVAPIGNLRIKEAAERFDAQVAKSEVLFFGRKEVCSRADGLVQYAHSLRVAIGGASGAAGDAPKLLLVETEDGKYALEGTIPDTDTVRHWLVKFPRGKKTEADIRVLQGEAAIYRLLAARGFNSIPGAVLDTVDNSYALWLPRFDRERTAGGIVRHGIESIYSMMGKGGDGVRLEHLDVIQKLQACVTKPEDKDALLAHYLARDVLNTATGNRDNHGRNTSLIKRDKDIELAPAYDVAPMVMDPEAIAMSTWWSDEFLDHQRNPDYVTILERLALNPELAAKTLAAEVGKLIGIKDGLQEHGAPKAMLTHSAIRFNEPERVLLQLERLGVKPGLFRR